MGQGQDKIARTLLELEPTTIAELFLIYFNPMEYPEAFFAFHGGSLFQRPITWQGLEYLPIPVETEGFEINANGRIARPKIRISNKDYIITDLLLGFKDLQFAKIIRKRTFVKYLDNINFDGGNPWGEADSSAELSNDTFIVSQKTAENKLFVEFELTYPLDVDGLNVNNRTILGNYCPFHYRGEGCGYNGIPLTNSKDEALNVNARSLGNFEKNNPDDSFQWRIDYNYEAGDIIYFENYKNTINYFRNKVLDNEPEYDREDKINYLRTYYVAKKEHVSTLNNSPISLNSNKFWDKDQCIKTIKACKKRFNTDGGSEVYTQEIVEDDVFLDFSKNKIPQSIAENAGIKLISNVTDFFPNKFYTNNFTIAMWISFSERPKVDSKNYSILTNTNINRKGGSSFGSYGLNYFRKKNSLFQSFRVIDKNKNISDIKYLSPTNLFDDNDTYQFCLFEYKKSSSSQNGYIQITLNNDTKSSVKYDLNKNESFAFTELDYLNDYFTDVFQINGNDYWGDAENNRTTQAKIHSVIIWSRNLNEAEKAWLTRENKEPSAFIEYQEVKSPRRMQEITKEYEKIKNNAILWLQDNVSNYNEKNKNIIFYSQPLFETQQPNDVYFYVNSLNYDIKNTQKNILKYGYKYTKTPHYWLPFGGFPGTMSFGYNPSQY